MTYVNEGVLDRVIRGVVGVVLAYAARALNHRVRHRHCGLGFTVCAVGYLHEQEGKVTACSSPWPGQPSEDNRVRYSHDSAMGGSAATYASAAARADRLRRLRAANLWHHS